ALSFRQGAHQADPFEMLTNAPPETAAAADVLRGQRAAMTAAENIDTGASGRDPGQGLFIDSVEMAVAGELDTRDPPQMIVRVRRTWLRRNALPFGNHGTSPARGSPLACPPFRGADIPASRGEDDLESKVLSIEDAKLSHPSTKTSALPAPVPLYT